MCFCAGRAQSRVCEELVVCGKKFISGAFYPFYDRQFIIFSMSLSSLLKLINISSSKSQKNRNCEEGLDTWS